MKYEESEVRPLERKVSLGVALQRGHAQIIYIIYNIIYIIQGKNVPRWRTAHASFIDEQDICITLGHRLASPRVLLVNPLFFDAEIPF